MTIKEQLIQAIDSIPEEQLPFALSVAEALCQPPHLTTYPDTKPMSTGASLLAHLQTIELGWVGDDLEDCLEEVMNSRGFLTFETPNPLDVTHQDP